MSFSAVRRRWSLPLGNSVIPQTVVSEVDPMSERLAGEAEGRLHERVLRITATQERFRAALACRGLTGSST